MIRLMFRIKERKSSFSRLKLIRIKDMISVLFRFKEKTIIIYATTCIFNHRKLIAKVN